MNKETIGIFDSGIGGLTVANAISRLLPNEALIYFGDTAHLPYGDKSEDLSKSFSLNIADFLIEKQKWPRGSVVIYPPKNKVVSSRGAVVSKNIIKPNDALDLGCGLGIKNEQNINVVKEDDLKISYPKKII